MRTGRRLAPGWLGAVACAAAAGLALVACGGNDAPPPTIGQPCGATTSCAGGEMCLADQPGGLCTRTCPESGTARGCGSGFLCDRLGLDTDAGAATMQLCLPVCDRDEDCRSGYSCNGVSGGTGKVCQPDPI